MCAMLSILDFAGEATDGPLKLASVSQFRLIDRIQEKPGVMGRQKPALKVGRVADLEREFEVFVDVLDPNEEGCASTLTGPLCSVLHLMRLTRTGTREDHAAVTSLKCIPSRRLLSGDESQDFMALGILLSPEEGREAARKRDMSAIRHWCPRTPKLLRKEETHRDGGMALRCDNDRLFRMPIAINGIG